MKLVSLNIEKDRHYDLVLPFLTAQSADVICLQEIPESYVPTIEKLGYQVTFAPMTHFPMRHGTEKIGIAIASIHKPSNVVVSYYYKDEHAIPTFDQRNIPDTIANVFIAANIDGVQVATTHFTWTPNGEVPNQQQKERLPRLLSQLQELGSHVLCGDMNIPRHHNELYPLFLKQYTDAIPTTYKSSLDRTIHRAAADPNLSKLFDRYMVDYLFTQEPFLAHNIELQFGISDHAAVVSQIEKRGS
jgi:endonuclease/exonuclease/phosphatase family metal-dependent hydrolase